MTKQNPLDSWHALQARIHDLSEPELEKLMELELKNAKRRNMVLRIHSKINKLRYARERELLTAKTIMVRGANA